MVIYFSGLPLAVLSFSSVEYLDETSRFDSHEKGPDSNNRIMLIIILLLIIIIEAKTIGLRTRCSGPNENQC